MELRQIVMVIPFLLMSTPTHSMGIFTAWYKSPQTYHEQAQAATTELQALEMDDATSLIQTWKAQKIQDLVSKGANPNVANAQGEYPLIFAAGQHWTDTVRFLLDHGANSNVQNATGRTALLENLSHLRDTQLDYQAKKDILEALLAKGANPDLISANGSSPLHQLIHTNELELITILLENGADPLITDNAGTTALQQARATNRPEIVKLLEKYQIQKLP